jgi:hypothetical protein
MGEREAPGRQADRAALDGRTLAGKAGIEDRLAGGIERLLRSRRKRIVPMRRGRRSRRQLRKARVVLSTEAGSGS